MINATHKPSRRRSLLLAGMFAVMASVLSPLAASHAGAQSGKEFACDGTPYIMQNGSLFKVLPDPADAERYIFESVNDTTDFGNSMAYDPATNYIYGVRSNKLLDTYDANGDVLRTVELQAPWPGGASYAATTLGDGRYVIGSYNAAYEGSNNNLFVADPLTGEVEHVGAIKIGHADFAFNPGDGFMYHSTNGLLSKIDPRDGSETTVKMTEGLPNGFGASWFDTAGNLFLYHNRSGVLYKVSGIATGSATWQEAGQGSPVSGTDAANCIGGLALSADIVDGNGASIAPDDRNFAPGDRVLQEYTLYNNDIPATTRSLTICDRLGDSRSLTGKVSSTARGKFASGGQVGDHNFCYQVEAEPNLYSDPDSKVAPPTKVVVEVEVSSDAKPGSLANQTWLDLDGNLDTIDQLADDPGTGLSNDATTISIIDPSVYVLSDAGLGEGPTCPATPDEKMLPPVDVTDVAIVDVSTSLYGNDFDDNSDGFKLLSGSWSLVDGSFRQQNTCGFDYTSLLTSKPVEHFAVKAEIRVIEGTSRAGFVFNQTSSHTRSAASVVELTDNGKAIQWGHYDSAGFYQFSGKVETPRQVQLGESFTLALESHGDVAVISFDGTEIAKMENKSKRGYIGLVTSQTAADFEAIKLVALPANA